ncbi:MAG: hypothetical protein AB1757_00855 [Acidobacteriota bacterium]
MQNVKPKFSVKYWRYAIIVLSGLSSLVYVYPFRQNAQSSIEYNPAVQLTTLENRTINESSGIAASHRNPGILWTHNDSGDDAFVYAFDKSGKNRGVFKITDAKAIDWEDLASWKDPKSGKAYLYLGDIGNNAKKRPFLTIYRVEEPKISERDSASSRQNPIPTAKAQAINLKYPDGNFDAETLMVHPATGDLYIITKIMGAAAKVFKLKAPFMQKEATLVQVGEVQVQNPMKGFFTGGDIAPDGRRVALCDYLSGFELSLPDTKGIEFDEIWKQPVKLINLGARKQGEAICYSADGKSLLATSEGAPCPLIEITRK